jgi:hypothetical protein
VAPFRTAQRLEMLFRLAVTQTETAKTETAETEKAETEKALNPIDRERATPMLLPLKKSGMGGRG